VGETTQVDVLVRQYERSWQMLAEAVNSFPAAEWRAGDVDYLIPARAAYHILEAAEFYASASSFDFPFGYRFDCDWEGAPPDKLPTQEGVLAYLSEVRPKVEAWLRTADLMAEDDAFPWPGGTVLDRAHYLVRHNHHHIGEMWSELKRRGHDLPDWH